MRILDEEKGSRTEVVLFRQLEEEAEVNFYAVVLAEVNSVLLRFALTANHSIQQVFTTTTSTNVKVASTIETQVQVKEVEVVREVGVKMTVTEEAFRREPVATLSARVLDGWAIKETTIGTMTSRNNKTTRQINAIKILEQVKVLMETVELTVIMSSSSNQIKPLKMDYQMNYPQTIYSSSNNNKNNKNRSLSCQKQMTIMVVLLMKPQLVTPRHYVTRLRPRNNCEVKTREACHVT